MKFFLSIFFCFTSISFSKTLDTLAPGQTLKDDNGETLVSTGQTFKFGFFSPWNSTNRYAGIWFKNVPQQTVVWVANKDSPLTDSSGVLNITSTGNIVILNSHSGITIWAANSSAKNPVLQLLNTGNLVLNDGGYSSHAWQSFDHPCDTLLPGMKLGWSLRNNQSWFLTSWKSLQDPSTGEFTYKLDPRGLPQVVLRRGSEIIYRSGPWDGVRFGGDSPLHQNAVFKPIFVYNTSYVYYTYENNDSSIISRFVVNQSAGSIDHLTWSQRGKYWVNIVTMQRDDCDMYEHCGPYGICNIDKLSPACDCPTGFTPKVAQDWNVLDWSGGCVLKTPLNCSANEGFRKFSGLKLPDNSQIIINKTGMRSEECKAACLGNCSCVGYAETDGSGCVGWFGEMLDIREYNEGGQDLFIRMAASELGKSLCYESKHSLN